MRAFVLTDLGFGDSGKGRTTLDCCQITKAHTVVRTGGPQAFHTAMVAGGLSYTFSQFGSGTLCGARTHLSKEMIVDPYAVLSEGRELIDSLGISEAFELISVHEDALVITPWQKIASRLRELARGDKRHSTVGMGVGEAVRDSEAFPDEVVRVRDISSPFLSEKLEAIRWRKLCEMAPILTNLGSLPPQAVTEANHLHNKEIVQWAAGEFRHMMQYVEVVDDSYLEEILREGTIVFEPSQGMLLDRWHGFHPYTTMARPDQGAAMSLLRGVGYQGEIIRLAITRAYHTRHGNGPFPTEDAEMRQTIADLHNGEHEWQGSFRVGRLDLVSGRYAIEACGGPSAFDGLVVTCMDRLAEIPSWRICEAYECHAAGSERFFKMEGRRATAIQVKSNTRDEAQLAYQQELGEQLRNCTPCYREMPQDTTGDGYQRYLDAIRERYEVPIAITTYGPYDADRKEHMNLWAKP